mmetsp:Transcript_18054/g.58351  ORF Transcript_18054/g.58351 Transcript_18054/m.58351 type:complete len:218 (+) Transcript_18054:1-654(+)
MVYDQDGSFRDAAPHLLETELVRYFPIFTESVAHPGEDHGGIRNSTHRKAPQGNAHCVASLKGEVDWIAMVPGIDTFLWSPQFPAGHAPPVPWAAAFLRGLEPHRGGIAALQLAEAQFAQGDRERGESLFTTYQLRSRPRREMSHTLLLNPENVLEVGMGHFALPRPGAILVNVSDRLFRVNHYVDFVEPVGKSRCSDCDILDQSLGAEMEQMLRNG